MSLQIDQLTHKVTGKPLRGFFIRNKANKVLAIGAWPSVDASIPDGFLMPSRKRYARDIDLCIALAKMTGLPIKWNWQPFNRHSRLR